jgi:Na+/melibiose symporter-like transporter
LYSATFSWLAVTGGRFLAPFLEHEAFFSDEMIGAVLATQCAVSSVLGSAGGSWADARERRFPGRGRAQVMFSGIVMGSTAFLLHGACHFAPELTILSSPEWHFFLRILWAFSSSLVMPVLDGMTLAHLQNTPGMSHSDYGKERLYGAVSWAIINLLVGPVLDRFGFIVMYPFAMIVTVISFLSIAIYVNGGQGSADSQQSYMSQTIQPVLDEAPTKDLRHWHWNEQTWSPKVHMWVLLRSLTSTVYDSGFLFSICCLSMGTSVVESLVFMFFEFLGGSNTLCGMTVALTVLFEIPIFQLAPWLLQRVGAGPLQLVACLSYIVRVVGYTLIPKTHIYLVLLLEPLHGVTYACSQTSSVDFVSQLMPRGSEASGQGLLGAFKGLGSVVGLFLGGMLEEKMGPRVMYRILASIVTVGMVAFGITSVFSKSDAPHCSVVIPQSESDDLSLAETEKDDSNDSFVELYTCEQRRN